MDYKKLTAPCGLDCFNCPVYHARENKKLQQRIINSHREKNIPMNYERPYCTGCRNEQGTILFHNMKTPCDLYRCVSEKGLDFCFECDDFPCDNLHPLADKADHIPHNTKVFNLCLIKKMGLANWAEDKAASVKKTYYREKWDLNKGCNR